MSYTTEQIATLIESIGLPCAYYQFPDDDKDNPAPPPPFICFYYPNSDNFNADNRVYARADALIVELYTDEKDFDREAAVEAMLNGAELPWEKSETYIESERMYMTTYTTEVYIKNA